MLIKTDYEHILVDVQDSVMSITLNRPEALNAFSPDMMDGLMEAIQEAKVNSDIRVVVLSGAGRSFSAGGDVKGMGGQKSPIDAYDHIGRLNELILAMRELEKPIIGAVHGFAAGAGFNLALACDMIIAAEESKFVLSFAKVGLVSDGGGSFFLTRLVGPHKAKELLFHAEPITAKQAYELGILNQVHPQETLKEEVMKVAEKLSKGPGKAYGFMKRLVNQAMVSDLDEILEQERITQATMITTEDHKEGVRAFVEKREPLFKGR